VIKKFFKKLKYTPHEIGDAIIIDLINIYQYFLFSYQKVIGNYNFLKGNKVLKDIHKNKRIFLLGNSPKLNDYDLKKLQNEIVIMVNRSFTHKDYHVIKPKYHIIVDPKLGNGIWPIEYLDKILEKNPDVTFLLNSDWFNLEKFRYYRNKKNVFWIKNGSLSLLFNNFNNDLSTHFNSSGGVIGVALSSAIFFGSKNIYFLGVELNGVINLLANKDSHFAGKDPDYKDYTSLEWARALNINSRGIRKMTRFCQLCLKNNISLKNLSQSTLFDFIPEDNFNNLFK